MASYSDAIHVELRCGTCGPGASPLGEVRFNAGPTGDGTAVIVYRRIGQPFTGPRSARLAMRPRHPAGGELLVLAVAPGSRWARQGAWYTSTARRRRHDSLSARLYPGWRPVEQRDRLHCRGCGASFDYSRALLVRLASRADGCTYVDILPGSDTGPAAISKS